MHFIPWVVAESTVTHIDKCNKSIDVHCVLFINLGLNPKAACCTLLNCMRCLIKIHVSHKEAVKYTIFMKNILLSKLCNLCEEQHFHIKHCYSRVVRQRSLPCWHHDCRAHAHFILSCSGKSTHIHINHQASDRLLELAEVWLAAPLLRHIALLLNDGRSLSLCGCLCERGMIRKIRTVENFKGLSAGRADVMWVSVNGIIVVLYKWYIYRPESPGLAGALKTSGFINKR